MDRFNALGRGTQIMLISSVLLLIVSFFNWQEVEFDLGPLGEGSAGVSAWDDLGGILMGILTVVLIARIVANLAAVNLPIPVSFTLTSAVLAFLIFALALIKNLTDDYSTWASYVGVVLAALIAVGAWLEIQAAGGVDSLKSEASSFGGAGTATSAAAGGAVSETVPEPPPPAPAPPAPPAPPAAQDQSQSAADAASGAMSDEPSTERDN
jgi:hypothetical protein